MSFMAWGITADGERVPLTVVRETSTTGMVIPSVVTAGRAFERVVVEPVRNPSPITWINLGADVGLARQSDGSLKIVP